MASYLDQQPYQFHPYIATLPVEAMVKVGMMKQQQYDEGVQKIRNLLDEQTNLPISRPVDREYLQNSINSVTGQLKSLGAADFSNQQLVQSVAGLTKKISKDPYIIDAVASTAHRKSELERRAELEKAGKTGVYNDLVFNADWNDYYNSTDMGRRFTATYTPYTDINKKAIDVIKALHPNGQKIEDPFEILEGMRTGRIADVMKKYSITGLTEPQIRTALMAAFTPDDYNQLRVESKARFMGVTGESMVKTALQNFETEKLQTEKALTKAKNLLPAYSADPVKYTQLQEEIKSYEERLGKDGLPGTLETKYSNYMKSVKDNPDEVKYQIYKDGFFNQFANGFKWTELEEGYADNPFYAVAKDKRDYAFAVAKENQRILESERDYKLAEKKLSLEYNLDANGNINWFRSGNETTQSNQGVVNFNNYVATLNSEKVSEEQGLIKDGLTMPQIENLLAVNARGGVIDPRYATSIQKIAELRNKVDVLDTYNKNMRNAANLDAIKGMGSVTLNINGQNTTIAPEDLLAIRNARLIKSQPVYGPGGTYSNNYYVADLSILNDRQRKIAESLDGSYFNVPVTTAAAKNPALHKTMENFTNISDKAQENYVKSMGKVSSQFVTQTAATPTTKEGKVLPKILGDLSALIKANEDLDIAADNKWSREDALGMLEDEGNAKVLVENAGNDYKVIITSLKDTDKSPQVIRASRDVVSKVFGEQYINKYVDDAMFMDLGKGNVSISNDPNKAPYQKQFGYFPNVNKYNIKGTAHRVSNSTSVVPQVWLEDVNGNFVPFFLAGENMKRVTGFESTMRGFGSMTDEQVEKLIRQSYPSYNLNNLKKYR